MPIVVAPCWTTYFRQQDIEDIEDKKFQIVVKIFFNIFWNDSRGQLYKTFFSVT